MSIDSQIIGIVIASVIGFFFWLRTKTVVPSSEGVTTSWQLGSWFLLFLYLVSTQFLFDLREDPSLLVHEGLTLQNKVRAGVTTVSSGWVLLLVLTKRLSFSSPFARSGFWLSVLILTFIASSFWSEWKEYALYRSIELGIYWALALHLFSNANWHQNLTRYLRFTVAIYIFGKLFSLGLSPDGILGGLRTNFGSVIAACLLTDVGFRFLYLRKRGPALFWEFVYGFVALTLFGSIATILISTAGFATLFFYRWPLRARAILLSVALTVSAASILVSAASLHNLSRIEGAAQNMQLVSAITGKNAESITSISGRIPLWEALWWETKDSVWGGGFASAERLVCIRLTGFAWMPPNAHNGYLSSWINAGWLGFILVLSALLAIWQFSRYSVDSKPLIQALLLVIIGNNWTVPILGSVFTPVWVVICCLAAAGWLVAKEESSELVPLTVSR